MTKAKVLSIHEQTYLDSLKRSLRQTAAEKIQIALKLSNLSFKLFKAASEKKK